LDIVGIIKGAPISDLVILGGLFLAVVIGAMQGTIRRLLGIASILFAFLAAANLRDPVGDFLAHNWQQFPTGYCKLLAFGLLFGVLWIGLSLLIQGFYKRTDIYAARPVVDDLLGALLGLVQGVLLLCVAIVILGSYSLPSPFSGEIDFLRQAQDILVHQSHIASALRDGVIPTLVHGSAFLLPADLVAMFP
jgi:uncharacterized membrane protein required for colicin V production